MKALIGFAAAASLGLGLPAQATAQGDSLSGPARAAANQLGACMARKTTGEDRLAFAGWMLAAMASSPDLQDVATVVPAKKDQLDRKVAALFTRLMTVDCPTEAKALFATKDPAAFRLSGEPLGRVAMQEIMNKPEFESALGAFANYIDESKFTGLKPQP